MTRSKQVTFFTYKVENEYFGNKLELQVLSMFYKCKWYTCKWYTYYIYVDIFNYMMRNTNFAVQLDFEF